MSTSTKENLQEIFDTSLNHIRKQGAPSVDPEDKRVCLYRGPNGLQCAAGPFVTDEVDEGISFEDLFEEAYVRHFTEKEKIFVTSLQSCHDGAVVEPAYCGGEDFMRRYERRMEVLADSEGLVYSVAHTKEIRDDET